MKPSKPTLPYVAVYTSESDQTDDDRRMTARALVILGEQRLFPITGESRRFSDKRGVYRFPILGESLTSAALAEQRRFPILRDGGEHGR